MKKWRPDNPYKKAKLIDRAKPLWQLPDGTIMEDLAKRALESGFEAGADAMLEALRAGICNHPIFLKNCKSQRKKPAKICIDCPFKMLLGG